MKIISAFLANLLFGVGFHIPAFSKFKVNL